MPEVKQPTPSSKIVERVQKPILKLPTDVLKGKTGSGRAAPLQALAEKVDRERKQTKLGVPATDARGGASISAPCASEG